MILERKTIQTSRNRRQATRTERRSAFGRKMGFECLEARRVLATLQLAELSTVDLTVVEHGQLTGDDRGGIAISDSHLFYTGDEATASFPVNDISGGFPTASRVDGLVSDVGSGRVFSLATDQSTPVVNDFDVQVVSHLLELDSVTASPTGEFIELSSPITLFPGSGIFSGVEKANFWDSSSGLVTEVDLASGAVTELGTAFISIVGTENWASWGIAEEFDGENYLAYVTFGDEIVRTRISDGSTSTIASFPEGLGDLAVFTVSPDLQRWYFHYEFGGFGDFGADEKIGFANATILTDLRVVDSSPENGEIISSPAPFEFAIELSEPVDTATVDASDFEVDGIAANEVDVLSPTELLFRFDTPPATEQGLHLLTVEQGAFGRESDGDGNAEFSSTFRIDDTLLEVESTEPSIGSTLLLPSNLLNLTFNEPLAIGSVSADDFQLSQGTVREARLVDEQTLQLELGGVVSEEDGSFRISFAAGALTDLFGNPSAGFDAEYQIDFGAFPYPTPLEAVAPLGSLVYQNSLDGLIDESGDEDTFQILVDPGQQISVSVEPTIQKVTLYEEDFESLELRPFESQSEAGDFLDWTNEFPVGWGRDNLGTPEGGPVEFFGWTLIDKESWTGTSSNGRRNSFTLGTQTIAAADDDNYADGLFLSSDEYNTLLSLPTIELTSISSSSLEIQFDSSFRPAGAATASVEVSFDGGASYETLLSMDSSTIDGGDGSLARANETISIRVEEFVNVPDDGEALFRFSYTNADNDWWWAIDNVEVRDATSMTTLLSEDFEGQTLNPFESFTEQRRGSNITDGTDWTDELPDGWARDNGETPTGGPDEYFGWSVVDVDSWTTTAGDQGRSNFFRGGSGSHGTIAVADPDEYDDGVVGIGPGQPSEALYETFLSTPEIPLRDDLESLQLKFDSSFRPEDGMTGRVEVSFDSGATYTQLLLLNTDTSGGFEGSFQRIDELIQLSADIPSSAETAVFRWSLTEAGNDWWWAIDNVEVSGEVLVQPTVDLLEAYRWWNWRKREFETRYRLVETSTADASGGPALIRNYRTPGAIASSFNQPTQYRVRVSGANESTGTYRADLTLNADVEDETTLGHPNNSLDSAQDLEDAFLPLERWTFFTRQPERAAIQGALGEATYAVGRFDNLLRTIDTETGAITSESPMTIADGEIFGSSGIAQDPSTGTLYALLDTGLSESLLVELDPLTAIATPVGLLGQRFGEITFDSDGNLYGITGASFSNSNPSSLFRIDKTDPTSQEFLYAYGSGGAGGAAFNPTDGLFYRYQDGQFQSLDLTTTPPTPFEIPVSGDLPFKARGMVYSKNGSFLLTGDSNSLFSIESSGNGSRIGFHGSNLHGLAGGNSDFYSFELKRGESATIVLEGTGADLTLRNADGQVLALGSPTANASSKIEEFIASESGTYYVEASGAGEVLVVTRNAGFDLEPNSSLETAQPIFKAQPGDRYERVLGHVSGAGRFLAADGRGANILEVDPETGEGKIIATGVGDGLGYNSLAQNPITGQVYATQTLSTGSLFQFDPQTLTETLIGSVGSSIRATAWSPDGQLLYAIVDTSFGTIDPATAVFTEIGNPGLGNIGGIAFSPVDGTLYAVTNRENGLYTLNLETGASTLVGDPGDRYNSLEFLPNGTLLAGTARTANNFEGGSLVQIDPATAEATLIGRPVQGFSANLTALELLPPTTDFYALNAQDRSWITAWARPTARSAGEFENDLDAFLRLYDSSGEIVAESSQESWHGRNAWLLYRVPRDAGGTYFVEILPSPESGPLTSGEYVLSIAGATTSTPEFHVTGTNLPEGRVRGPLSEITLHFNDAVLASSLDASDLSIGGLPATSVTLVDANSVSFSIPELEEGIFDIKLAADSVKDLQGTNVLEFAQSFYHDVTAPTVLASSIEEGSTVLSSSLRRRIDLEIEFSEPIEIANLSQSSGTLLGTATGTFHPFASAEWDPTQTVLSLTYLDLPEDSYQLTLFSGDFAFEDTSLLDGWDLDGDNDGNEGGDFVLNFALDITAVPFPQSERLSPAGSLIYETSSLGLIGAADDLDAHTLRLDPQQTVSVLVHPTGSDSLQPEVELLYQNGDVVASATSTGPGESVLIQTSAVDAQGLYAVVVKGAEATTGSYDVNLFLNSALETESIDGLNNLINPQDIDDSFIDLADATSRGAVIGQVGGELFAGSPFDGLLRTLDPATGQTRASQPIELDNDSVLAVYGIAKDPSDGQVYALLDSAFTSGMLATIDLDSAVATPIGSLEVEGRMFRDIVFDSSGSLYGATGGRGNESQSLFRIDKTAPASQEFLFTFSTRGAGAIALNPDDGLLYRFQSGQFESIDTSSTPPNVTPIPTSGDSLFSNAQAMTYRGNGQFYLSSFGSLYSITAQGVVSFVDPMEGTFHGFTFEGDSDAYSFSVLEGQFVTLVGESLAGQDIQLTLADSAGSTALASSSSAQLNSDEIIYKFGPLAEGTYQVLVEGNGRYSLTVLNGAVFDLESNSSFTKAQDFNDVEGALGYIGASIVVPAAFEDTESFNGNAWPFHIGEFDVPSMRYQQIYSATQFPEGGVIDSLRFRRTSGEDEFTSTEMDMTIRLGYAATTVDTASGFFDDNLGQDIFTVFDGQLILSSNAPSESPQEFDIVIDVLDLFEYDPRNGDLIMEIEMRNSPTSAFFAATPFNNGGSTTRIFADDSNAFFGQIGFTASNPNPYGLITKFDFGVGTSDDWYAVELEEGFEYAFPVTVPANGSGEFGNGLVPSLELYDSTGKLVASGDSSTEFDEELVYAVPAGESGTYRIRVSAEESSRGEYFLISRPAVGSSFRRFAGQDQPAAQVGTVKPHGPADNQVGIREDEEVSLVAPRSEPNYMPATSFAIVGSRSPVRDLSASNYDGVDQSIFELTKEDSESLEMRLEWLLGGFVARREE